MAYVAVGYISEAGDLQGGQGGQSAPHSESAGLGARCGTRVQLRPAQNVNAGTEMCCCAS